MICIYCLNKNQTSDKTSDKISIRYYKIQMNHPHNMICNDLNCYEIQSDISCPSLCIPRMYSTITRQQIFKIFTSLKLGLLDRVDIIPVGNGKFQRVFVHFKSWYNSSLEVSRIRERILSGKDIKVIYDGPFIWKVSLNRASIHK